MSDSGAEIPSSRCYFPGGKKIRSLTERTLHGLFWTLSGKGTLAVLQIGVLMVLARLLTPEDFGLVAAALVIIGLSEIFSQLGVGPAIVQRRSLDEQHIRVGLTVSVLLSLAFCGAVYMAAPWLAAFFRMDEVTPICQMLALVFPLKGLTIVAGSLLQRDLKFRTLAAIEVISYALGYGAVGITLALLDWGVWSLVAAQLGQALVKSVLLFTTVPHPCLPSMDVTALRDLLNFGAGLSLGRIGNYVATKGDNLVVGRWLGAEALGIYGRAYQFLMMPVHLVGRVVDRVLFPAMAEIQDDRYRLRRAYLNALAAVATFTLPLGTILVVLAPELVRLFLGPQWDAVIAPFQILAAVLVFRVSYKISDTLARAAGVVYRGAWRQWFYASTVVGGAWAGHHAGLVGISLAVAIAIFLKFSLMLQLSISLTGSTWQDVARAYWPGIHITVLLAPITLGTTLLGRSLDINAIFVVLLSTFVVGAAALLLLITVGPRIIPPPTTAAFRHLWIRALQLASLQRV